MGSGEWVRGAFGLDAGKVATIRSPRTVLGVAHHLTGGTRVTEMLGLLERDHRIQVVYTVSPASPLATGAEEYLRSLGGMVIPWGQAVNQEFDLAVAAGHGGLQQLHAPVLAMSHGAGDNALMRRWAGHGPPAPRPVTGPRREMIIAGGRVIPSALALAHDDERAALARTCPEAAPVAFVAGDYCFDRMTASLPFRERYREALGATPGTRLVVVSSTWGENSLLGRCQDVLLRLAKELPADSHRIVAVLHPNTWCVHGRRQVRAWSADPDRHVRLVPPEEGWRAALVAADRVIGDHGSVTCYGAALGVPVLRGTWPRDDVAPGSPASMVGAVSPRLDWDRPLVPQLDAVAGTFGAADAARLRERITSRPGAAARLFRSEMYRLLRLPEPAYPPHVAPVPLPAPLPTDEFDSAAGR